MKAHSFSVASDVERLSTEQLEAKYNITKNDDGSVFDHDENLKFLTLKDWIVFIDTIDQEDDYGVGCGRMKFYE